MSAIHADYPNGESSQVTQIIDVSGQVWIRMDSANCFGKFELWFMVRYFSKLIELLISTLPTLNGQLRVPMELTETNASKLLGPRLVMPESLKRFFEQNL